LLRSLHQYHVVPISYALMDTRFIPLVCLDVTPRAVFARIPAPSRDFPPPPAVSRHSHILLLTHTPSQAPRRSRSSCLYQPP
jgi:hypothetical protein